MDGSRFRTALLASGAAIALTVATVPASADETSDLRSQIEALQAKLATLEQNQVAAQQEQQYVKAPANAVVGGDKPGSFRLPGSNTSVAIGGYAKLDVIYDFDQDVGDSFNVGAIALEVPGPHAGNTLDNNFTLHAKQSRLWVKTWTPTDWGEFETHIEADFLDFTSGANHLVSNSFHLRLRHAYGRLGNVLAGQTWSNFNTPFQWAGTIDFWGAVGTSFIRQAQIRYTAPLGDGMSLAISIENPETDGIVCFDDFAPPGVCSIAAKRAESFSQPDQNVTDPMPDIVARFQWGADWGTIALAAVGRYFNVTEIFAPTITYSGVNDQAFGWGVNIAGVVNLPWGKDRMGAQFIYGDGIGRYALWNSGNAFLAFGGTNGPPNVNIETVEAWGGNAWIEHWWTDSLYSVGVVGYGETNWPAAVIAFDGAPITNVLASVHVNLQWKPTSRTSIGIEGMYGHRQTQSGLDGDALRLQMGFTWGFST